MNHKPFDKLRANGGFYNTRQYKIDCLLEWLQEKLTTATGVDQLESFSAKFSRLQDTLGDKLLPLFLKLSAEPIGTAIENLNRAEKLGLIMSTQQWLEFSQFSYDG